MLYCWRWIFKSLASSNIQSFFRPSSGLSSGPSSGPSSCLSIVLSSCLLPILLHVFFPFLFLSFFPSSFPSSSCLSSCLFFPSFFPSPYHLTEQRDRHWDCRECWDYWWTEESGWTTMDRLADTATADRLTTDRWRTHLTSSYPMLLNCRVALSLKHETVEASRRIVPRRYWLPSLLDFHVYWINHSIIR